MSGGGGGAGREVDRLSGEEMVVPLLLSRDAAPSVGASDVEALGGPASRRFLGGLPRLRLT